MRFHGHVWETTQNQFYPPENKVKTVKGVLDASTQMVIFGHTTITQKCTKCGDIKSRLYVGEVKA